MPLPFAQPQVYINIDGLMDLENAIQSLEELLQKIENPQTPISVCIQEYESALQIATNCIDHFSKLDQKISVLKRDGEHIIQETTPHV